MTWIKRIFGNDKRKQAVSADSKHASSPTPPKIAHPTSLKNLTMVLGEHLKGDDIVIVDFFAPWCGPCKTIGPVFQELSTKYENITFVKVDGDKMENAVLIYDIQAFPTFVAFKGENEIKRLVGGSKTGLETFVAELVN